MDITAVYYGLCVECGYIMVIKCTTRGGVTVTERWCGCRDG